MPSEERRHALPNMLPGNFILEMNLKAHGHKTLNDLKAWCRAQEDPSEIDAVARPA